VGVHLAAEHALQLEPANPFLEPCGVTLDVPRRAFIVFALGEVEELRGVGDGLRGAVQLLELRGEPGTFAPQLLRLVGLLPDGGVLQLATYLFEAFLLAVVLKETP